jgi:predicted nucleotidyltransferase
MALAGGADLVLELPIYYSTGSAEFFAGGAISVLNGLGCVNFLGFGSESDDIDSLSDIAAVLAKEPPEFTLELKENLRKGMSFASARAKALITVTDVDPSLINSSNDILGIEYIKALILQGSSIKPISIKRQGSDYHEKKPGPSFSSAEAIRGILEKAFEESSDIECIREHIPDASFEVLKTALKNKTTSPATADAFSTLLYYKLLSEKQNGFDKYLDISSDLSDKIISNINEFKSFSDFVMRLKSKDLAYARINRALLHILLNITDENMQKYVTDKSSYTSYARILGFRKNASFLLKTIKETATIPVISRLSDAYSQTTELQMSILNETIMASNVYNLACGKSDVSEYAKIPVIHK